MVRRCPFCDSPVPSDATTCPVCKEEIGEETLERLLPLLKRPESPDVRFLSPVERLWGTIRRPGPTFRDIGRRPDTAGPVLLILINALIVTGYFLLISSKFTTTVIIDGTPVQTSILNTDLGATFYLGALGLLIGNIMMGIVYFILGSAFAHLAFKIMGGVGNRLKTMSIVGYSIMPIVLVRLVGLAIVAVMAAPFDLTGTTNLVALVTAIYDAPYWTILDYMTAASFAWVGFLLIFGIREAHNTSTLWAFVMALACMTVLMWTFWQVH